MPLFEKSLIEKEIKEQRQWKIVIDNTIVFNWTITLKTAVLGAKDQQDAIYIHRIAITQYFGATDILMLL